MHSPRDEHRSSRRLTTWFHVLLAVGIMPILSVPLSGTCTIWAYSRGERRWARRFLALFLLDLGYALALAFPGPALQEMLDGEPPTSGPPVDTLTLLLPVGFALTLILLAGARRAPGAFLVGAPLLLGYVAQGLFASFLPDLGLIGPVLGVACMGVLAATAMRRLGLPMQVETSRPLQHSLVRGGFYALTLAPRIAVIVLALATGLGLPATFADPVGDVLSGEAGGADWVGLIVLAVLVAPIVEEIAIRGLLLGWLRRWTGDVTAIGLSALVFALFHPHYGAMAGVVLSHGIVLGWLRVHTGGLRAPIALHAVLNGVVALFATLGE